VFRALNTNELLSLNFEFYKLKANIFLRQALNLSQLRKPADTFMQFCVMQNCSEPAAVKTDFTHFNFSAAASSFPNGKLV